LDQFKLPAEGWRVAATIHVVRSVGECGLQGSYDSGGAAQIGLRDPGIDAAPLSCS
jgi:hypothetical protein